MIILDTDHVTLLKYPHRQRGQKLATRLLALPPDELIGVAVISVEEQMRGWLASIAKEKQARRQVFGYRELTQLFEYFNEFTILPFDEAAADRFELLRSAKLRIGTMDLKIAAITLVQNCLLLSGNRSDFDRVPDLRVEDWTV